MKRFLFFLFIIIIALLLYWNWKNRHQIVSCAKETGIQIKCEASKKFQDGKDWAEKKVSNF